MEDRFQAYLILFSFANDNGAIHTHCKFTSTLLLGIAGSLNNQNDTAQASLDHHNGHRDGIHWSEVGLW